MEAAAEPHRQRRAQPAEPRNHPGHRLLAEGVPRRRGTRAAAVSRHAPLLAHAHQVARRDRGGDPRPAPAAAVRADEVRHVEPRVPLPRRRARGALGAAPRAALPGAGGGSLRHDDWGPPIRPEGDGRRSPLAAALLVGGPGSPTSAQAPTYRVTYRLRVVERTGIDTRLLATAVVSGPPETNLRLSLQAGTAELQGLLATLPEPDTVNLAGLVFGRRPSGRARRGVPLWEEDSYRRGGPSAPGGGAPPPPVRPKRPSPPPPPGGGDPGGPR